MEETYNFLNWHNEYESGINLYNFKNKKLYEIIDNPNPKIILVDENCNGFDEIDENNNEFGNCITSDINEVSFEYDETSFCVKSFIDNDFNIDKIKYKKSDKDSYGYDKEMNVKFYNEYIKLNGKLNFDDYIYYKNVFLAITIGQVGGNTPLDRNEYYKKWYSFIGSKKEGNTIFRSIDNVETYS